MENKPISSNDSSIQSQKILKKYHQLTSPLVSLQTAKKQDTMKNQLRQNVSMKLDCIKNKGSKIYALDSSISFSELKAGAALYQIPEFSVPQVNFQISDQIKKKVTQVKNQIISFLPEISKSSNYAPKKIEHQLNHRTAVRQLSQWLNGKLKNPPTNLQESIQYKNMIMGVGMKELIRIISKRCTQQGKMAEQIWELTWSICRQIIIYLSNRAKKCQELLEQQLAFMRLSYQKEYTRMTQSITELSKKVEKLEAQNQEYQNQLSKIRKRKQNLEEENKAFSFDNFHLQREMKKVLEENLAIYLQIGDKTKKGWIRKMYKNINALPEKLQNTVKILLKQEVSQTIEDRMKLQEVTGEYSEIIPINDIENIGNAPKIQHKTKKYQSKVKKSKKSKLEKFAMMTMPANIQKNYEQDSDSQSIFSENSCSNFVGNMRQEFKPVDSYTQTQMKKFIDAYASTFSPEMIDKDTRVQENMLILFQETATNTEQIKEEVKVIKKKGKENSKEESRSKDKGSKILTAPPLKEKTKQKIDKQKKGGLQIVQELKYYQQQSNISKDKNQISAILETSVGDNTMNNEKKNQQTNLEQSTKINNNIKTSVEASNINNQKTRKSLRQSQIKSDIMKQTLKKVIDSSQQSDPSRIILSNKLIGINFPKKTNREDIQNISKQIHSTSIDSFTVPIKAYQNDYFIQQKREQCILYICAQCNKAMDELQQKFLSRKMKPIGSDKNEKSNASSKKSMRVSPSPSFRNRSPEGKIEQPLMDDKHSSGLIIRKEVRKNSSYIHDITYKKQLQQQQIPAVKSPFYSSKDQSYDKYDQSIEEPQAPFNNLAKIPSYLLFYQQIQEVNKAYFASVSGTSQQTTENLEQYLQLVKQINSIQQGKISMNQKSTVSTIEKNIFPIMNEMLLLVKKAIKTGKILETMRSFTSLPNIIYNRITRKYGVKILAVKNLKILLMALKNAGKYTDKYKIIELMMFTDCKSPHSQDFFLYLFIMALFDPNFSANKSINSQQLQTVKNICEQYLSKQPQIYNQVQKILLQSNLQSQSFYLNTILKSIITNYRIFKINRIQDIGFIYLMLKSNHQVNYKRFIYFLSSFNIEHKLKVQISKKLLEFCDIKNKDQKIAISEIMFSKFLMSCEVFTFKLLEYSINNQIENYKSHDHEIVKNLSTHFFKTEKYIQTKYQLHENLENRASIEHQQVRQSISIVDSNDYSSLSKDISSLDSNRISEEKILDKITVLKQIKEYSPFSQQICSYLQNIEETKHLTQKQQQFIKNYLIVHIIQSEIEKTLGLVDYFSTSILDTLRTPTQEYILLPSKKN